jgi:pimeloyl-ACP methyl ester carboxylesterase
MLFLFVFLILTLVLLFLVLGILFQGGRGFILWLRNKPCLNALKSIKRTLILGFIMLTLNVGVIVVSGFLTHTPQIKDENGNFVEGAIAELKALRLNGRKQWVSNRGWNPNNPLLLFLAGGPGGTQMAAVRHELAELEKHFVVVNWDQPGSGKSYNTLKTSKITVDTYLEDGYALTEYLKMRFKQEKIYLMGESWGSALGIFLLDQHPESYHAFIGTGQMVAFLETEKIDYAKAMELALQNDDQKIVERLQKNGEPPYYGKNVTWKSAVYLNYLNTHMAKNPQVYNAGYNTIRDLMSSEYSLRDKINFFRGIINTFNHVYPQLYDIDLRSDYAKLDVPVYFFLGRHDLNAPISLAEEYFHLLEAPKKGLIWFEHSAHNPWINERDLFVEEVLSCFLSK